MQMERVFVYVKMGKALFCLILLVKSHYLILDLLTDIMENDVKEIIVITSASMVNANGQVLKPHVSAKSSIGAKDVNSIVRIYVKKDNVKSRVGNSMIVSLFIT